MKINAIGHLVKANPIQIHSNPIAERVKLMQSVYLQGIMKKIAAKGYEKTKPKQTQFKPCPERSEFTLSVIEGNGPILPPIFKISVLNFDNSLLDRRLYSFWPFGDWVCLALYWV